ncbi:MAG TPA: N-acetylmuramoyl-L-alanine amidase [Thermodesulfobacteriota bacterium]|nr:N-acetylmuramoyl-L-alanine amidase [Thermodesulfobacteriota bacterium]
MISKFTGRKELKIRQDILRGVYEENLCILGRGRPVLARRRSLFLKGILLSAVFSAFAVLMPDQHTGSSFAPTEPAASTSILPALLPPASASGEATSELDKHPLLPAANVASEGLANADEFSAIMNSRSVSLMRMLGLKIKTIMIDAGHGGSDSGTIGKIGTKEKDITLDIAKRLKAHLIKSDLHHVLMTREDDSSVPLLERVTLVREAKADLFISIHLNYLPKKSTNIIETYYFGPSEDKKTLRLAEQENAGSEYGLSDFKEVVEMLGKTMKLQESKELAESIQANLFLNSRKHDKEIQNHGVKRAPFVVLLGVDVPSVLAEVSCLSNPEEERELNLENHRENIASFLAAGIFDYLNKGARTHEAKR